MASKAPLEIKITWCGGETPLCAVRPPPGSFAFPGGVRLRVRAALPGNRDGPEAKVRRSRQDRERRVTGSRWLAQLPARTRADFRPDARRHGRTRGPDHRRSPGALEAQGHGLRRHCGQDGCARVEPGGPQRAQLPCMRAQTPSWQASKSTSPRYRARQGAEPASEVPHT
jgi:hypothetical protein